MFGRLRLSNRKDFRQHADYTALPAATKLALLSALSRFITDEFAKESKTAEKDGEQLPKELKLVDVVSRFAEQEDYGRYILSVPQTYALLKASIKPTSPIQLTDNAGTLMVRPL